ncbi:MAG: PIN domain nuclease [Nitrospira sp.]|nr:PIN domain nuclease [Nitrospira sp.]
MIVVDTSVWIEFLEARGTSFDAHLAHLIDKNAPLALTDLIYCEVLQGIHDDPTHQKIHDVLRAFPILMMGDLEIFDRAVEMYRRCRRKGITIRSTVDCLIAAMCLEADAELYHNDRDFMGIAKVHGLKLYQPKAIA